ncbi:MAG: hypothetical protein CBD51_004555 [Flavobacteriales bacterium TMED191]|nr:MAG: hypothetical protein CBD51_004555 [Flavobacteriales bacterium TMED191]
MKCSKIIILLITIIFHSCEDNKYSAHTPSYIEINHFKYDGNTNTNKPHPLQYQSTNITDGWISMNGEVIGVFEMPCQVPILSEGLHSFDIYPGIKVNGIAGNRAKYPFYNKFEIDVELIKDQVIPIYPTTSYHKNVTKIFETQGTFEQPGTMFERVNDNDTVPIRQNYEVFQGQYSTAIYLDSVKNKFEIRNIDELELPLNSFMELDFKSNISFNIGLIIINSGNIPIKEELIQLYPTESWKKIYLDLYPLINLGNNNSKYKIYIDGQYNDLVIKNAIYIDNLKLVHNNYD